MEHPDVGKGCSSSDYGAPLSRNRSFKAKQLVRSQAIRESTSPPRTISPSPYRKETTNSVTNDTVAVWKSSNSGTSSHSDRCSVINIDKKQPIAIHITAGAWDEAHSDQRQRARRWLGHRHHSDSSRYLQTHGPRIACVCGACECPNCRGRRRHFCAAKQNSGIVCSDDCLNCIEMEHAGPNGDGARRMSGSLDDEDEPYFCRCIERKDRPKSISLGANEFEDKTDLCGPDLIAFIKETLNKNSRDRATLLKIEKELQGLVTDNSRCIVRFPVMTSYGRMLVHRCAALFQLAHHVDHSNKNSVLVSKSGTCGGRLPCTSFRDWCTAAVPNSPTHEDTLAKSILKRCSGPPGASNSAVGRSKSLEQRERDYERVRRRIFSSDNCTKDETQWPWLSNGPVKLLTPATGRNKLLKVHSLENRSSGRGVVSKSHSFGGYTDPQHRVLSRQGDLASSSWRVSSSSSGYKTLSLRSTDSVTPSPTGGASPEPGIPPASGALVWALTDVAAVSTGAVVLHPQTGRPLTNPDGSIYHFDPENPPLLCDNTYKHTDKIDVNAEKRRGKLEKQHSFIDNECEIDTNGEKRCDCPQDGYLVQLKPKTLSIPLGPMQNQMTYEEQLTKPNRPGLDDPSQNEENAVRQTFENLMIAQSPVKENDIKFETTNQKLSKFESANQVSSSPRFKSDDQTPTLLRFDSQANQIPSNQPQRFETANRAVHIQRFDSPANQVQDVQRFDSPANQVQAVQRFDSPANQVQVVQRFESPANQVQVVQRFESPASQVQAVQRLDSPASQVQVVQRFDSPANQVQAVQRFDSPANEVQAAPRFDSPANEVHAAPRFDLPANEVHAAPRFDSPANEVHAAPRFDSPANEVQAAPRFDSPDNEVQAAPRFDSPDNEVQAAPRFDSPDNEVQAAPRFDSPDNEVQAAPRFDLPLNEVQADQRVDSPANQRQDDRYDLPNRAVDTGTYEFPNNYQVDLYQSNYLPFKNEIPHPMMANYQPEMAMQDQNMRGVPNQSEYYLPPLHNYQNPCRTDQQMQHLQPQMYPQMPTEEYKHMAASPHSNNTFRIDPSYPYAADLTAACGGCEPPPQQRGYNVQYQPERMIYPNVMMQPMQHYPYQEQMQVQWPNVAAVAPKMVMHDVYPIVYPNVVHTPYNIVYPQMIPQYPMQQYQDRRKKRYERERDAEKQNEIALKIQQIKRQVNLMSGDRGRNNGGGILGSAPRRPGTGGDGADNQLSSAARAIVNSIRPIQGRNYYQESRRSPPRQERPDLRRRTTAPVYRQMSPNAWNAPNAPNAPNACHSQAPMQQAFNQPRRGQPDTRNQRR